VDQIFEAGMNGLERPESAPDDAAEERRLLAAIRGGDRTAAEDLVERTYNGVYAALFRMCGGDADLAADLTQDVFRKAWEALPGFDGRSKVSTWLFRIAYTTFLNHVRRPRRIVPLDDVTGALARDPRVSALEAMSDSEENERVRQAVLALPEELRFTVTAHFWANLPVSEIARVEKITSVAIRKRLKRAFAAIELALHGDSR
jgi:RNA polymerase sigma-70 factor (ECF subfamily)